MAVNPTQEDYDIIKLKVRSLKIKIDLLNFQFQTINSFEGNCVDGAINIDANADIRRTCSLTLELKDEKSILSAGGQIWIDRYIKIYQGIYNPKKKETTWWNMGMFLINNPNSVYNKNTNQLSFEGIDLMAKLTGKRNGQLEAISTVIPAESNLANVVKSIITELGGFTKYIIDDVGYTIPYDIKKDIGSTIYDLLTEIRDLYSNWEMYFDTDGVFHWQKIPTGEKDPVLIDLDILKDYLIIEDSINIDFENVKNNIIVYGRVLDDGHQVMGTAADYKGDSPFSINSIGEINYIIQDEMIYSDDLANQRARYELYLHSNMNDTINLSIIPCYWLNDVNVKINYNNPNKEIQGEYLIKSLSIPLDINSVMTISAIKVYPESYTYSSYTTEFPATGNWHTSKQTQIPYYKVNE